MMRPASCVAVCDAACAHESRLLPLLISACFRLSAQCCSFKGMAWHTSRTTALGRCTHAHGHGGVLSWPRPELARVVEWEPGTCKHV
jgi:hypothetical protein